MGGVNFMDVPQFWALLNRIQKNKKHFTSEELNNIRLLQFQQKIKYREAETNEERKEILDFVDSLCRVNKRKNDFLNFDEN